MPKINREIIGYFCTWCERRTLHNVTVMWKSWSCFTHLRVQASWLCGDGKVSLCGMFECSRIPIFLYMCMKFCSCEVKHFWMHAFLESIWVSWTKGIWHNYWSGVHTSTPCWPDICFSLWSAKSLGQELKYQKMIIPATQIPTRKIFLICTDLKVNKKEKWMEFYMQAIDIVYPGLLHPDTSMVWWYTNVLGAQQLKYWVVLCNL